MDVGELKHTVIFKTNTQSAANSGGFTDNYSELLTTKGYMKKKNGLLKSQSGELVVNNGWDLTVRYQSALENNLSQSMIVEYDSRVFNINDWQKVDEKNFYYLINLTEKVV